MNFKFLLNRTYHLNEFMFEFNVICNTETLNALHDKVEHIVLHLGDFNGAVRMLNSFRKGVKSGLPTDTHGYHKRDYYYKDSPHGEYLTLGKNLNKAHFRWNWGVRYTLTESEIKTIDLFLKNTGLYKN